MALNNQIEVTLSGGFLTILNTSNPDSLPESYNLANLISVKTQTFDYTALELENPGRFERPIVFEVILDFEEAPTDLVYIKFDIQNVTNQVTWTSDLTGLAQAYDDILAAAATAGGGGSAAPATGINDGRKVVAAAGTAEALVAVATPIIEVTITAELDNTDTVVIGGSGVIAALATRVGTPLEAGDSRTLQIDDLSKVFVDALVSGEGVTFSYLTA